MTPYIEQVIKEFRERFENAFIWIKLDNPTEIISGMPMIDLGDLIGKFLLTSLTQQDEMVRKEERGRIKDFVETYVKQENCWDESSKDTFNKGALQSRNKFSNKLIEHLHQLKAPLKDVGDK